LAWEAIQDIKAHMDRVCQLTLPGSDAMLPLIDRHRAIVAALDACDEDAAAAAMCRHLTEILRALPRVEAEHPELFSAWRSSGTGSGRPMGDDRRPRRHDQGIAHAEPTRRRVGQRFQKQPAMVLGQSPR
jgi:hypothetical protein